uniref:Neprosin PEP catalytic domain-containing protein n=1 Tax=Thermosporothrix sp. COM3 TaxID=2490863 RepID=A0A455SHW8_9CHLR|nr:hypothetical protein KTC_04960 [Thermosporothrix sp. COM3]
MRQKPGSRVFLVLVLTCCLLFMCSGTAFARSEQTGVKKEYTCVKAPQVALPRVQTDIKQTSARKPAAKPICPAGQVPQPVAKKSGKHAPPMPQQATISAGYHYVTGIQNVESLGTPADFTQHQPYLSSQDYHTLAEIAALNYGPHGRQIVEIGWTVDRAVNNGDDKPHLFVFSWVNDQGNCYNGCGFVQVSNAHYPGMQLASDGSLHHYAIYHYQGNWWLNYDNDWIGYFPDSIWTSKGEDFSKTTQLQWFGEVASGGGSHTQMGNGIFGSQNGSARIQSMYVYTTANTAVTANVNVSAGETSCFDYGWIQQPNAFRYGGPGC